MDVGYLLVTAGVVLLDFKVKNYVDKTYVCGESHVWEGIRFRPADGGSPPAAPGKSRAGRIVIEKYYNRGAALNFLERRPGQMRVLHACMFQIGRASCRERV